MRVFSQRIAWRDAGLSYQIRSTLTFGAEIQNLGVLVVIGDCAHDLILAGYFFIN